MHLNIVAVAALLDLSAVIITEGAQPDQDGSSEATSNPSPCHPHPCPPIP